MPETVGGVPIHPLVVHAVVVLLPLAAVGVLVLAVVPRWRRTFAPLVLAVTVVATALAPVAKKSGENLRDALGVGELVERHAQLGTMTIWFALALLGAAVAVWWVARRERAGRPPPRGAAAAVSVVAVLVAAATLVQVVLVGHSGSKAVWEGTPTSSSAAGD
jgi:uncharacterized membrane protein